jgi:hypothetical protein
MTSSRGMTPKLNVQNFEQSDPMGDCLVQAMSYANASHTFDVAPLNLSIFNFVVSIFSYCNDLKRLSLGVF